MTSSTNATDLSGKVAVVTGAAAGLGRAEALGLQYRSQQGTDKLLDLTSLATSLAMDFAYTGRFTG